MHVQSTGLTLALVSNNYGAETYEDPNTTPATEETEPQRRPMTDERKMRLWRAAALFMALILLLGYIF